MKCDLANLSRLMDRRADVRRAVDITKATIMTVGDLVRIVECCHTGSYQYRGQRHIDWDLYPSLTRPGGPWPQGCASHETWRDKEKHILREFRTLASQYLTLANLDTLSEVQLAMLAQHHGSPTRLLDWTMNPLAALYFAVEEEDDTHDSVVWALHGHRERMYDLKSHCFSDFDSSVHFVIPDHTSTRAAVQASIFAFWGDPTKSMDKIVTDQSALWKISVPVNRRPGIKWALFCLGINRESLFPDLDGVGMYLQWKHSWIHQNIFDEAHIPLGKE